VTVDYVRGCRYAGVEPDHAIVVHPGIASHPCGLDSFCAHHADRGVDVWTPDDQFSRKGSADGLVALGAHVAQSAGRPVFVVGSSRDAAVIHRALELSDGLCGAVLIGDASPSALSEQLAQSLRQNTKPVLWIVGDRTRRPASPRPKPALARSRCKRTLTTSIS
jgi:hypothetical protein